MPLAKLRLSPTTLLDLPRELRDIIYTLVLLSPSAHLTPLLIHAPPRRARARIPQYALLPSIPGAAPLTLSLLRVNRQIAAETHALFWARAVFCFASAHALSATLKDMGQVASRLVRRVRLAVRLDSVKELPRALRAVASRGRLGALESVDLVVDGGEMARLECCRAGGEVGERIYDGLLEVLREGGVAGRGVKRGMVVEGVKGEQGGWDIEVVRELHWAWGGTMEVEGKVVWKDYVYVGGGNEVIV